MTQPVLPQPLPWKRNLAAMGLAQAFSSMGISFIYPFLPLLVFELDVREPRQVALWAGIASGIAGVPMLFAGPIWGLLADRYGRKKNALRALFGSAFAVTLQGLSLNIYHLVFARFLYGVLTGVHGSAQALVASSSPRHRITFGLGVLQAAWSMGNTIGPAMGAAAAALVGIRGAFVVAAVLLAAGGVFVLAVAREDFQPSSSTTHSPRRALRDLAHQMTSRRILPLLPVLFLLSILPAMMLVALPLLLRQLTGGSGAWATGGAFSLLGLAAVLSSYLSGWLADRLGLVRILVLGAAGLGIAFLPLAVVSSLPLILGALAIAGICQGALTTATAGLVGHRAPREQHGAVFGSVQSIGFIGFTLGPLLGGVVASVLGLRAVFLVQAVALLATAPLIVVILGRQRPLGPLAAGEPTTAKPEGLP
ncbi:MAG: MFS transporter [Chloroflexi bacterium]|nr:MFS transporter [Chloroflexota bacterium]